MELPGREEGPQPLVDCLISASAVFEGTEQIAEVRDLARSFLSDVQVVHGLRVSSRATGMMQLVAQRAGDQRTQMRTRPVIADVGSALPVTRLSTGPRGSSLACGIMEGTTC
jgi:hypothetical protein